MLLAGIHVFPLDARGVVPKVRKCVKPELLLGLMNENHHGIATSYTACVTWLQELDPRFRWDDRTRDFSHGLRAWERDAICLFKVETRSGGTTRQIITPNAERVGFEPTLAIKTKPVFETGPFNHSGTSPKRTLCSCGRVINIQFSR